MKLNKAYRQMLTECVDELCGHIVDHDITDAESADLKLSIEEIVNEYVPDDVKDRVKKHLFKKAFPIVANYIQVNGCVEEY